MITLKTLPEATAQEVFDQVARHLLTQKEKSQTPDGACLYRLDALKCAAGCLIADSEYLAVMDDGPSTAWAGLVDAELVPNTHKELISELQAVHDDDFPEWWKDILCDVAGRHELSLAVLEEFK